MKRKRENMPPCFPLPIFVFSCCCGSKQNTFHSSLPAAHSTHVPCPRICCLILRAGTPEQMWPLLRMINRDFNAAHCRRSTQHFSFKLFNTTPPPAWDREGGSTFVTYTVTGQKIQFNAILCNSFIVLQLHHTLNLKAVQ